MRFLALSLFSILFTCNVFSQQFSEQLVIGSPTPLEYYDMTAAGDHFFVALTNNDPGNDFRKTISLLKLDSLGQIQWSREYSSTSPDSSISVSQMVFHSGQLLLSGTNSLNNNPPYRSFIMALDTAMGDVLWTQRIANSISHSDLFKLDPTHVLVDFRRFEGGQVRYFSLMDENGQFSTTRQFPFSHDPVIHTEPDGDERTTILLNSGNLLNIPNDISTVHWQRKYFNAIGINFSQAANGDYLFCSAQVAFPGHMTVFRTDSTGNVLWSRYVEATFDENEMIFDIVGFHFITEDQDGNVVVCANSEGGLTGSYIMVFDDQGEPIHDRWLTIRENVAHWGDNDHFYHLGTNLALPSFASNLIAEKRDFSATMDCDGPLEYTTEIGQPVEEAPDEIVLGDTATVELLPVSVQTETINIIQQQFCELTVSLEEDAPIEEITIYPNPTNGQVFIDTDIRKCQSEVYSSMGKQVESFRGKASDLGHLEPGIYQVRVSSQDGLIVATTKLVITR